MELRLLCFEEPTCRLNLGRCAVVPGTQEKFPLLTPSCSKIGSAFAAVHESAFGTKRTFTLRWSMSAFGGKADIDQVAPRLSIL
jgi:hypothetical protein